jgi:hypothetical protein
MAEWWNWQTRDAQNVVPQGMGVRLSPWSLDRLAPGSEAQATGSMLVMLPVIALTTENTENTEENMRCLISIVFSVTSVCSVVNAFDDGR